MGLDLEPFLKQVGRANSTQGQPYLSFLAVPKCLGKITIHSDVHSQRVCTHKSCQADQEDHALRATTRGDLLFESVRC